MMDSVIYVTAPLQTLLASMCLITQYFVPIKFDTYKVGLKGAFF